MRTDKCPLATVLKPISSAPCEPCPPVGHREVGSLPMPNVRVVPGQPGTRYGRLRLDLKHRVFGSQSQPGRPSILALPCVDRRPQRCPSRRRRPQRCLRDEGRKGCPDNPQFPLATFAFHLEQKRRVRGLRPGKKRRWPRRPVLALIRRLAFSRCKP